jgi:hypothetical protein
MHGAGISAFGEPTEVLVSSAALPHPNESPVTRPTSPRYDAPVCKGGKYEDPGAEV